MARRPVFGIRENIVRLISTENKLSPLRDRAIAPAVGCSSDYVYRIRQELGIATANERCKQYERTVILPLVKDIIRRRNPQTIGDIQRALAEMGHELSYDRVSVLQRLARKNG